MDSRIILHVDMDYFFAAVEISRNPELKGKPVVIGADPKEGKGRGVVTTSSPEARKHGIFSATPISTAYKRCPEAIFVKPNFSLYSETSKQIMSILKKYSTRFQQMSCDEAYLDITEKVNDFADAKIFALKIKNEIYETCNLTCSIGIGTNKLVAKIASDLKKPDAVVVVEDNKKFLAPLPIRKLYGVGKKTEPKITSLGIETIGDLANFSREKLINRFGTYGLYLSLAAGGNGSDFVGHNHERSSISKERTFFEDTTDHKKIKETIETISDQIYERLVENQFAYKTISIKIRYHDFRTFTRSHSLQSFSTLKSTIKNAALYLMEEFNGNKIRLIGVKVSNLSSFKNQAQLESFIT